jgi:methylenetetrahydrofolate dehydrogenase (NADP+)/methenyltetrahydrofolate cyclohydrolase
MIINCKKIREKEISKIKETYKGGCKVVFIQIGENPASNVYVRNKINLCKEVGIEVKHIQGDEETSQEALINSIKRFNLDKDIHGIMVQLPLPEHISEEAVINAIAPEKDIDGFTTINKGKLMIGDKDAIIPCTPKGIMTILEYQGIDLNGKIVTIVGRSNIVGKPLAQLMINAGATVTVCNSKTDEITLNCLIAYSDIFISAIGKANHFNKNMFEFYRLDNTIAIDVGINRDEEGKLCGDIDKELYEEFKDVTSVPGGVGVMTVLEVIKNSIECYERCKK